MQMLKPVGPFAPLKSQMIRCAIGVLWHFLSDNMSCWTSCRLALAPGVRQASSWQLLQPHMWRCGQQPGSAHNDSDTSAVVLLQVRCMTTFQQEPYLLLGCSSGTVRVAALVNASGDAVTGPRQVRGLQLREYNSKCA
jgi:hypothetical protein